jgi:hypothetical protein
MLRMTSAQVEKRDQEIFPDQPELMKIMFESHLMRLAVTPVLLASLFTSIWVWLYAVSGFLLKAARRFDIGFALFNRKVDIERKPLSAIGLVAGALVAIVYWGYALAVHFHSKLS